MPCSPNDYKRRRTVRSAKRTSRASVSLRKTSPASSRNVVAFQDADAPQARDGAATFLPEIQQAIDTPLSFTPIQLLAVIIKAKLSDRVKDEEVNCICQVYYAAILSIWGDDEE